MFNSNYIYLVLSLANLFESILLGKSGASLLEIVVSEFSTTSDINDCNITDISATILFA